jgi:hypothetical protein
VALIVMGSAKGAPGVSTSALALSASWPGAVRPVVWEADAGGGDVVHRFPVREEPGLVSLAGALGAEGLSANIVAKHTQLLPGGVPVLAGPSAPGAARRALAALDPYWEGALPGPGGWLVDVGRIDAPAERERAVLAAADAVVLVAEGSMASLTHTSLVADLVGEQHPGVPVLVAVVGPCQFSNSEILEALHVMGCVRLPYDPAGAALLGGRPGRAVPWWRGRVRYPLLEQSARLALALEPYLPAPEVTATEPWPPAAAEAETSLRSYIAQAGSQ